MVCNNYKNTYITLKTCEERYKYLSEKKEELYVKYVGLKALPIKDNDAKHQPSGKDKVLEYFEAITTPQENGLSIDEELEQLAKEKVRLNTLLNKIGKYIKSLDDIEYQLYAKVVIDGIQITKAVKEVSKENFVSESSIWHTYVPKIKNNLIRKEKTDEHKKIK